MNYVAFTYAIDTLVAAMEKKNTVEETVKTVVHLLDIKDETDQMVVYGIIDKAVENKNVNETAENAACNCIEEISETIGLHKEEHSLAEIIENAENAGIIVNETIKILAKSEILFCKWLDI